MVDNDRSGPPLAALWQLQHLAFTPNAKSITNKWVTDILESSGFVNIQIKPLISGMTKLLWANKP